MQSDIVLSGALRSKECEHSAKHVLYEVTMHLEKNIFILTSGLKKMVLLTLRN